MRRVAGFDAPASLLNDQEEDPQSSGGRRAWRLRLEWMGVVSKVGTVGAVDASIAIGPLRECLTPVPFDGFDTSQGPAWGLLETLPREMLEAGEMLEAFDRAVVPGGVGGCSQELWTAIRSSGSAGRASHHRGRQTQAR